jgi:hypothetical protein
MSNQPSRLSPSMLGTLKGQAAPPPEQGSALLPPRSAPDQPAGGTDPSAAPTATAHLGLKKRGESKARVNLTYRASQERQEWLRQFVFEQRTTIQDLIDAALRRMLPDIPD